MQCIKIKNGFTLAEVLITLGIIGVVAALTLTLIINTSSQMVLNNQFKNVYSMLYAATYKIKADSGYYPECRYDGTSAGPSLTSQCVDFWSEFKKQLNIIKSCTNNSYSNGCIPQYQTGMTDGGCGAATQTAILNTNPAFILQDGTIIFYYTNTVFPLFFVDINGFKGPNRSGYDVFSFLWTGTSEELKIVDAGCKDNATNGKSTTIMLRDVFR